MAGGPRLALSGWSKLPFLAPLRNVALRHTGTLEGALQPNWCQLFLATFFTISAELKIFLRFQFAHLLFLFMQLFTITVKLFTGKIC
ncbi:MAG: hypothetical protein M3Q05_15220 [Bacteroidota bacterium]|nr:hypothetical protein [Bacteroidota bacterium]